MVPEPAPVVLSRNGATTTLKWHRARRTAGDAPFTAARIVEGLRAGACVEVDLLIHADRGFAVLHDDDLTASTTGKGKVRNTSATYLRSLTLRDPDGRPSDSPVLLLEDLAGLLDGASLPATAMLQLDVKVSASALDPGIVDAFARTVKPIARHTILSCGDARVVAVLTGAVPALAVGYDPCHGGAVDAVLASGDFTGFVDRACAAAPRATMIYLEIPLILAADDRGADLIAEFHRRQRAVDAYTFGGPADPGMTPLVDRLLALGADQLTVDDPAGLVALRAD
ncbi:glycerophosphodiester phosphodiesterase [Gordonia caeni]|uniref:Glycerophosphoryl diester phosphodiesterase n=1 Tax=Gordonia caeni TaxID=1007097 RepID=A0ABP7NYW7_9ACTN